MNTLADTADLLGSKPAASPSHTSPGHTMEFRFRTVHFSSAEHLGKRLGVDASTILDLMGVPERTRARRRHEGFFKADEADRLLRIARVFGEAIRVFGSEAKAALWLKAPSPLFENATPLSLLDSDGGAAAVSEELVRIEFGEFA